MTAATGLTSAEAATRLAAVGVNEPAPIDRGSLLGQLARPYANPLVSILLVASAVSASAGQRADALIIAGIVLVSTSIDFMQTFRSQRAADRLRALVTPKATVLRDGRWIEIARRGVVPGDVLRLGAGDLVPADARLLEARNLSVHQAMLTGESLPVDKAVRPEAPLSPSADDCGAVFLGTSIVSGTGIAVVTATGPRTLFGDIAVRLRTRAPDTEFDRGLRRFSLLILRTTVALVLFILLMGLALRRDPLESLLFAVALGVGLTPEFLPMIESVTLTAGALRMAREGVVVKHLPAIQNIGSIDVLCSDKTGTLTTGVMTVERSVDMDGRPSDAALRFAAINSRLESGVASPLDRAILTAHADEPAWAKVDEMPFDFDRRRVSVVADGPDGRRLIIVKGAPESVLPLCAAEHADDLAGRFAADGLRVLAVATREVERRTEYSPDDERSLTLAGFVAFSDPLRADAAETLAALQRDGVAIKILTGDNDAVSRHVCARAGLGERRVVTGDEVGRLDDAALGHVAEEASIFARVSPAQKNRIIAALKRRGHVVGFLGHGINDAPSLHAADVGISVMTATDVARDAAEIVLGESGLAVIHRGIVEGRRASGNMLKYLLMGTSSNFGNMVSMAVASTFLPFLPMLPTQILLNNFLYDVAQITIPTDRVDRDYVSRPRRWDMRLVGRFMLLVGPVSSIFDFLTFFVLLRVFHADETLFHTGWFVESLATQTLVLFVVRTFGAPWKNLPSRPLVATAVAVVVIGVALPATPIAAMLGFVAPPPIYFGFLAFAVATYLLLVEAVKRRVVASLAG